MKDKQLVIAALFLSIGMTLIFYNTKSVVYPSVTEIKRTLKAHEQQYRTKRQREQNNLPTIYPLQLQIFVDQWRGNTMYEQIPAGIKPGSGKYPALLWHRFSFIPNPALDHWMVAM